jgi:hypothetical protein
VGGYRSLGLGSSNSGKRHRAREEKRRARVAFAQCFEAPVFHFVSSSSPFLPPHQVVMGLGSGTLGVTRAWVAEQTERHKR